MYRSCIHQKQTEEEGSQNPNHEQENLDCKPYKPSESKELEYIWNVDQLPIHLLTGRSYGLLAFTKLGLKIIIAEKVGKG